MALHMPPSHARRRRRLKRAWTTCRVVSALSILLALIIAAGSFLIHDRAVRLAWWTLSGGLLLISGLAWGAAWWLDHMLDRSFRRKKASGGVLLLVLVMTAVLALLVAASFAFIHVQALAAARSLERERLLVTASWKVRAVAGNLPRIISHHPLGDFPAEDEVTPDNISLVTQITDLSARFDINNLTAQNISKDIRTPAAILTDLLTLCGDFQSLERVEALKDWVDPDDQGFYESDLYLKQNPPYRCANTFLRSWKEILLVKGFSRSYFAPRRRSFPREAFQADPFQCLCLIPTARTRPLPVNVNTAPPPVLTAILGLSRQDAARRITETRQIRAYRNLEPIRVFLGTEIFRRVSPYLSTRSSFFEITARASRGSAAAGIRALVKLDGDTLHFLRWQEIP